MAANEPFGNNPNPVGVDTRTRLLLINNCVGAHIHNCKFLDHVGVLGDSTNDPDFVHLMFSTYAVDVTTTCRGTRVSDCLFQNIGLTGLLDDGSETQVDDCLFDRCLNQGFACHAQEGHTVVTNTTFQKLTEDSFGYSGGVNADAKVPVGTNRPMISFIGCKTYHPWSATVDPQFQTVAPMKLEDAHIINLTNTSLIHGVVNTGNSRNASMDLQGIDCDKLNIKGCYFSGFIDHLGDEGDQTPAGQAAEGERSYVSVSIEDSVIGKDTNPRHAVVLKCRELITKNSEFYYYLSCLSSQEVEVYTHGWTSESCRYHPDETVAHRTAVLFRRLFDDGTTTFYDRISFDQSNTIVLGGVDTLHGSQQHLKAGTPTGNPGAGCSCQPWDVQLWQQPARQALRYEPHREPASRRPSNVPGLPRRPDHQRQLPGGRSRKPRHRGVESRHCRLGSSVGYNQRNQARRLLMQLIRYCPTAAVTAPYVVFRSCDSVDNFLNRAANAVQGFDAANWANYVTPMAVENGGCWALIGVEGYDYTIHDMLTATPLPTDPVLDSGNFPCECCSNESTDACNCGCGCSPAYSVLDRYSRCCG